MAWTIGGSVYPKYNSFYLAAEGVDIEDLNKRKEEYLGKVKNAQFWEAFNAGKPTIYAGIGLVPPPEFLPKVARLTKGKTIFDYGEQGEVGPVVSAKFKAAHDKIQPGGNQFIPIQILNKDGSPYEGEFFVFQIDSVLDAINPSLGGFNTYDKGENITYYARSVQPEERDRLAVYKDRIIGKAAWRDPRYGGTICDFASDAFLEELAAVKAEGFDKKQHFHEI